VNVATRYTIDCHKYQLSQVIPGFGNIEYSHFQVVYIGVIWRQENYQVGVFIKWFESMTWNFGSLAAPILIPGAKPLSS